jgi:hypothetical protein
MSEWWTYSLSSFLLFSPRTYYRLFELYNADIWPAQILAVALGVVILVSLRHADAWHGRIVAAILAGCWIWVAWAFHWQRYATINWAATYFAAAFAIEALLLIWTGVFRNKLTFKPVSLVRHRIGICIFLFALVLQPLIGPLVGREWAQMEIFGVAPDPTVVGTLGVLLLASSRVYWELLVVPLLWCALSGAVTWTMKSPDAPVMPIVALAVLFLASTKRRAAARAAGNRASARATDS